MLFMLLVAILMPVAAAAVSPTDYDVPVSTAQQLRVGGSWSYAGQGDRVDANDGTASLVFNRYFNSLTYAWDLSLHGVGTMRRAGDAQEGTYNIVTGTGLRRFLSDESNLFYASEMSVVQSSDFDRPAIEVTPGVGYGRFIRVTPLAQAVRISEFLQAEGVLPGPLPDEALIALAQIIERQAEYLVEHGEAYKVPWYNAMEDVIVSACGCGQGALGAIGTLRINEVLFEEHVNERFIGWDVRAGMRLEALAPFEHLDRQTPGLSLRARYSRPVGWRSQMDVSSQYHSPGDSDFGKVFTWTSTLNYLYEVTNRVDYTLSAIATTEQYDPDGESTTGHTIRSGFVFFIENQVNLNITGSLAKEEGQDYYQNVHMAIEYRLR